jgi:hypothetical protein
MTHMEKSLEEYAIIRVRVNRIQTCISSLFTYAFTQLVADMRANPSSLTFFLYFRSAKH